MANDDFDNADFYTCADEFDALMCTSPREAIAEWLDDIRLGGRTATDVIREQPFIKVTAYRREVVDQEFVDTNADALLEYLSDWFYERYGSPDCDDDDTFATQEALPLMKDAVRKFVESSEVWCCDGVATRTYSADEVEAMMREYRPGWFEESR